MLNLTIGTSFNSSIEALTKITGINLSFFGAPGQFRLDGGRIITSGHFEYLEFTKRLRSMGIPFNLCCNTVLDEMQVEFDENLHEILKDNNLAGNGYIVSRMWLARKLRKLFPSRKLIYSSIGYLIEKWDEDAIFDLFDVVVCPVEELNNFDFLRNSRHYRKLEVFLNNECTGFNKHCYNHYLHNSKYNTKMIADSHFVCPFIDPDSEINSIDVATYRELGVTHFKLIDRTSPIETLTKYLDILEQGKIWQ